MLNSEYRIYYFIPFVAVLFIVVLAICSVIVAPIMIFNITMSVLYFFISQKALYMFIYFFIPTGIVCWVRSRKFLFGLISFLPGIELIAGTMIIGERLYGIYLSADNTYTNPCAIVLSVLLVAGFATRMIVSLIMNFRLARKASLCRADGYSLGLIRLSKPIFIMILIYIIIDIIIGILAYTII